MVNTTASICIQLWRIWLEFAAALQIKCSWSHQLQEWTLGRSKSVIQLYWNHDIIFLSDCLVLWENLCQEKFAGCEGSFAQRELLIVLCQEVVDLVEDLYLETLRTHDGLRIFQVLDLDVGLLVVHHESRASVFHRQDILLNGKR